MSKTQKKSKAVSNSQKKSRKKGDIHWGYRIGALVLAIMIIVSMVVMYTF